VSPSLRHQQLNLHRARAPSCAASRPHPALRPHPMLATPRLKLTDASPRAIIAWGPCTPTTPRTRPVPSLPSTQHANRQPLMTARALLWRLSQPRPVRMGACVVSCTGRPSPNQGPVLSPTELAGYRISSPDRPRPPATPCFRRFILMFQVFYLDVAKVNLGCCICCNDNIRMLQAYVSSVLCVSDVYLKCFIWMLHTLLWLYTYVSSVSDLCCKCFI
jgi:hypothetical protein